MVTAWPRPDSVWLMDWVTAVEGGAVALPGGTICADSRVAAPSLPLSPPPPLLWPPPPKSEPIAWRGRGGGS